MSQSAKAQGQKEIRLNLNKPGMGTRRDLTAKQEMCPRPNLWAPLSARDSRSQTVMGRLRDTEKGDKTGDD